MVVIPWDVLVSVQETETLCKNRNSVEHISLSVNDHHSVSFSTVKNVSNMLLSTQAFVLMTQASNENYNYYINYIPLIIISNHDFLK